MIDVMLVFIKETDKRDKSGSKICLYYCTCGKFKQINKNSVKQLNTRSCGCLQKLRTSQCNKNQKRTVKHGMSSESEYHIWVGIKDRCLNKNSKDYPSYGATGISICQLWEYSFKEFYNDMGPRPSPDHSIHRIDNDNGYYPKNCKWATRKEQQRRRTCNRLILYNGVERTLVEWSEILNIPYCVLQHRLDNYGWDVEKTFTEPIKDHYRYLEFNGEVKSLSEWGRHLGIDFRTIWYRLNNGWSTEEALTTPTRNRKQCNLQPQMG